MAAQNNHLAPTPNFLLILTELARGIILSFYSDILVKDETAITVKSWSLRFFQHDIRVYPTLRQVFNLCALQSHLGSLNKNPCQGLIPKRNQNWGWRVQGISSS